MFSFQNTNFINKKSYKQRHNFDVINFLIITKNFLSSFWKKEAYRSHPAEFILYFLTISGLFLWDKFDLSWSFQRTTLTMHILVSLVLFPVFVLPFWLAHRNVFSKSPKIFLRRTGRLIEFGLIALTLSGLYLFLLGNRGDFAGQIAYWTHLLLTLPLLLLVIRHAMRWVYCQKREMDDHFLFGIIDINRLFFCCDREHFANHWG